MRIEKKVISNLPLCYSIAPFVMPSGFHFLVAAEKKDPCYLFDEDGNQLETVWTTPGGVMTMVQVPGSADSFLATHQFYSPNDSAKARIVIAKRLDKNNWDIRTLVDAPFVHRFGIMKSHGAHYLIVCCLKSGHAYKEDWTSPGQVFAALLPTDLSPYNQDNQLPLTLIKDNLTRNHGFSIYEDETGQSAIISADNGIFRFSPPSALGQEWAITQLYDQPVSDAVLMDFDQDGEEELGCLAPFHGNDLFILKKDKNGVYQKVWAKDGNHQMWHATYACQILGKPAWLVGDRKGERDLLMITFEDGGYKATTIDHDVGPANAMCFKTRDGLDRVIAANRETNQVALYTLTYNQIKGEQHEQNI